MSPSPAALSLLYVLRTPLLAVVWSVSTRTNSATLSTSALTERMRLIVVSLVGSAVILNLIGEMFPTNP